MECQPIDTAPADGYLLLFMSGIWTVGYWVDDRYARARAITRADLIAALQPLEFLS